MKNPFLRDSAGGSFLPQDYVKGKHEFRANLICLGLFGVVMFGVVSAFFVTNRQWIQVRHEQQVITADYTKEAAKIEQLKKLDDQNAQMLEKAEITTALVEQVPRSVLLRELINRLPDNITLTEMVLEGKRAKTTATVAGGSNASAAAASTGVKNLSGRPAGQVSGQVSSKGKATEATKVEAPRFEYTLKLTGIAKVNNEISDYLHSLQESPILDGVDLRYIKETEIDRESYRKFEIQATIRKGADGRALDPNPATVARKPFSGEKPTAAQVTARPGVKETAPTAGVSENKEEQP
jgi:Tfp pilus assembly protein PilN